MEDGEPARPNSPRRVIWSVTPEQSSSPYISDIVEALEESGWTVDPLSLHDLASTRGQIVHVQWPEHVSRGGGALKVAAKHARALALLGTIRARGHRVVLTAHNIAPHGESDQFDAWFRAQLFQIADALIVLVPSHEEKLRKLGHLRNGMRVVHIDHPTPPLETPVTSDLERSSLLILGLIHPYHRILEFVDALTTAGNTRPVEIVGRIGDDALADQMARRSAAREWLRISPGYISNEDLKPILERTAAVVSLQRTPFNSGGPYFAFPRCLPVILSEGSQATHLSEIVGPEWVFAMPRDEGQLDIELLERWIRSPRDTPAIDDLMAGVIATKHTDLYQLLLTDQ